MKRTPMDTCLLLVVVALGVPLSSQATGSGLVPLPRRGDAPRTAVSLSMARRTSSTTLTPIAVIRQTDHARRFDVDLLLHSTGHVIVIDPFFRAPGLSFATAVVFSENGEIVEQVSIPRSSSGGPEVGSINVPAGAIVGRNLVLEASTASSADEAGSAYFLQLLVCRGVATFNDERPGTLKTELVARSTAVEIGRFSEPVHFRLISQRSRQDRNPQPNEDRSIIARVFPREISDHKRVIVTITNRRARSVRLFDPWFAHGQTAYRSGNLWLTKADGERVTDLLVGGMVNSVVVPTRQMCLQLPPQAVAGRIVGVSYRTNQSYLPQEMPEGVFSLQLVMNTRFLCDERNLDTASGEFHDAGTETEQYITSNRLTFSVGQ